jgi:hypothetical protein
MAIIIMQSVLFFFELATLIVSNMMVRRKVSTLDPAAGTYLIWFLATIPVAFHLQVTSYLGTWVLFLGSVAHRAACWSPCFFLGFLQFYDDDLQGRLLVDGTH